jgi:hypothetical protein
MNVSWPLFKQVTRRAARNFSIILGKWAQRATTRNGALWQKAQKSSVFSQGPPQRANSRNGILWPGARGKRGFWRFRPGYGALWSAEWNQFVLPAASLLAKPGPPCGREGLRPLSVLANGPLSLRGRRPKAAMPRCHALAAVCTSRGRFHSAAKALAPLRPPIAIGGEGHISRGKLTV